ncbi:MAG: cytochrome P450 [Hyphomonadaceae bacterium]|nr:cytochrome P450 [Hyphomonadaceae bacterium]
MLETDKRPSAAPYVPPRPSKLWSVAALARTLRQGDGDLLSLLPGEAFRMGIGTLGYSRRSIYLLNDPALIKQVLFDDGSLFPKSDLMVNALEPLIGESIFVTDGPKWRRQRAMIDPAFSHMRLNLAFSSMTAAVEDRTAWLSDMAQDGTPFSLDLAMSHLTADVICRTVFSVSLDSDVAKDVFDDFVIFERDVAQVKIWRLIVDPAWTAVDQSPQVLAACERIRKHLGDLTDTHLNDETGRYNDIASAVIAARDADTGEAFTRDELIDQLGVFFLAGHETSASALTWAFYILAVRPELRQRVRAEVEERVGDGPITIEAARNLPFVRSFFKEVLRLYPPITFMPRVAEQATELGGKKLRRGALVMIAPWTLHRHETYWPEPDRFDAERFLGTREREVQPGTYIPFGQGPHTCIGAGFATLEASLIIASLIRDFEFEVVGEQAVRPVARLTTRPAQEISVRVKRHRD